MDTTLPFSDADFRPLNGFELAWRWTEEKHNILPQEALASIRPLTRQKAQELWVESSDLFTRMQGDILLSENRFSAIAHMDASGDFEPVYNWLKQLPVADDPLIIVLWGREIVVLTLWSVFCLYWDDFCYPMSDDVAVWPLSATWALVYAHYEKIIFGIRATEA